ncbi:MAG: chemotaxis protein CheD [Clostridia bacterium]|nr:chemotaxis protein CheD [Clostridia bacterium]
MGTVIKVGIADLNTACSPDVLISYALGSCVGICLYDGVTKIAGMAHILLPQKPEHDGNLMKYANTAIPLLVDEMEKLSASKARLTAKIAGGANMFSGILTASTSQIGERNIAETKATLDRLGIKIVGEDTGGNYGRTIEFNSENGILYVRSLSKQNIEI